MITKTAISSFKNVLVSFVLIVSMFFSSAHTAFAQVGGLLQGVGGLIGGGGSLAGGINIQGVGAVALQCASTNFSLGEGNNPFSGLFGNDDIQDDIQFDPDEYIDDEEGITDPLTEINEDGGVDVLGGGAQDPLNESTSAVPSDGPLGLITGSVPVNDAELQKITNVVKSNTTVIKTEEKKETKKEECLDRIAQWAAITVLDKITFATLEWINSGFEGKPFFLENPSQFFSDLATKELLGFSATFTGDPNLYPFGQTLVRTILLSFQRTAEQNMINSLNAVLAHGTIAEWQIDFSVGGWAGYTAFIEPNNNIIGSYIESAQLLQRRLEGTRISQAINIQTELQQGLGFLSQKSCVQTQNGGEYIPENSIRHISVGVSQITNIDQIPTNVYFFLTSCDITWDTDGDGQDDGNGECIDSDELVVQIAENYRGRSICTEWRTKTPGNQISESLTRAVGMSQDQLLMVDEINENLGLLLDAFMLQLINEGITAFDSRTNPNNVLVQQVNGGNPGSVNNTVPFIDAINGFAEGEENQFAGIIPLQEEYIEKTTNLVDLYQEIIQRTLDLDYCIPGPNPGWQQASANAIGNYFSTLPAYESMSQTTWVQYTPTQFIALVAANALIPDVAEALNNIYSEILQYFTGLSFDPDDLDVQLVSRDVGLINRLYSAFDQYAALINQRYILSNDLVGGIRQQAYAHFFDLGNVNQERGNYQASVVSVQGTLNQLIALREEYADIERSYIVQQLQIAINQQGITNLADNLQQFQSFTPSQVTYIGIDGQNSSYHNAVLALIQEFGQQNVSPPQSYPGMAPILEEFVELMPNTATQEYIDTVDTEIAEALENIGNTGNPNSLIGLVYSCVQQVSQIGPFTNVPFVGYNQRIPYPYPISQDIPGLPFLPVTDTFIEDITISTDEEDITIPLTPSDEIDVPENLQIFESMFINIGQSLF